MAKKKFGSRLAPYNKPFILVIIGLVTSLIQGCIFPTFGVFITKNLFTFMIPDKQLLREGANAWCLYMFIAALVAFGNGFIHKFVFGVVGENITLNMRRALYYSIIKKHIGWFDNRDNAPGVLTATLASEAQVLNGASTEGLAVVLESTASLICGLALGFVFSWRLTLVALGAIPFVMIGGAINAKFYNGMTNIDDKAYKDANLLASDAIINYRTVAGLASDKSIVKTYAKYIEGPY